MTREQALPGALRDMAASLGLPIGYQAVLRSAAEIIEALMAEVKACPDEGCGLHDGDHTDDCDITHPIRMPAPAGL